METFKNAIVSARAELTEFFLDTVREFLRTHPEFRGITWRQYTPLFNDGEPCLPTMDEIYFLSSSEPEEWQGINSWDFEKDTPGWVLATMITENKDVLFWLFGMDQQITITATEVIQSDYQGG